MCICIDSSTDARYFNSVQLIYGFAALRSGKRWTNHFAERENAAVAAAAAPAVVVAAAISSVSRNVTFQLLFRTLEGI